MLALAPWARAVSWFGWQVNNNVVVGGSLHTNCQRGQTHSPELTQGVAAAFLTFSGFSPFDLALTNN